MATIIRRIAQDGTVSYLARVRRKGAPPQAATFANRSEAQRWVHITEGAILEGRHFPTMASRRHTLTDALDRYEQNVLRWKAPGTIAKQKQILRWWRTHPGYITLTDITTAVMIEKQMALAQTLAPATCNLYCNTLSHVLSTAVRWEWLAESPMRKVTRLREPRGRVRYLNDEERERLLTACRESTSPYLYLVVVLALATGARKTEIQRWSMCSLSLDRA